MPTARSGVSSMSLGEDIFVIGGAVSRDGEWVPVDNVECVSINENKWTILKHMLQGMFFPITTVIDNYIYVLFNDDDDNKVTQQGSIRTLQRYHHISQRWSSVNPLPDSVSWTVGAQGTRTGGSMYVVGGRWEVM